MSVLDEIKELKESTESAAMPATDQSEHNINTTGEPPAKSTLATLPTAQPVLDELTIKTMEKASEVVLGEAKDVKTLAKDLTYLKRASDLQDDETFTKGYDAVLSRQLIKDLQDEGKRAAIVAESKKIEARNLRNQAYYSSMKPIFTTLGIKEPFGMAPMVITTILLMIPYLIISLAVFVVNSINKLFVAISEFSKPAFWISTIIVIAVIAISILLAFLYGIDVVFGTHIVTGR